MKLDEFMENAGDEVIYYIGSNSSYFFVGTKKMFEEDIDKLDKKMKELGESRYLFYLEEQKKIQNEGLVSMAKTYREDFEDFWKKRVGHTFRRLNAVSELKNQYKEYSENYIPLCKREVVDTCEKLLISEKGVRVIIDGSEHGCCWFLHEYQDYRKDFKRKV